MSKEYPKQLIENREKIECNFIFSLWQDPSNIAEYKNVVNGVDIITEDGQFYYGIMCQLNSLGYNTLDHVTIDTYLSDKKDLYAQFELRGGYKTVQELTSILDVDNLPTYYDELVKNNMLLKLYDEGFDVMRNLSKLSKMSSTDIYDYYDFKLNNICVEKIDKLKAENLSEGYEQYIEEWDKGAMVGYKIGFPMLNYRLAGVHKSNLLLHLAHIGNGKTTSSILFYVLPAIESGENVCIIANEQGVSEFRQMILSTVVFNKVGYRKMNRQKFIRGNFNEEEKEAMREGAAWLKNCPGKITFIETEDYSIGSVKKIIKQYSKLAHGLFIFDTLKPAVESSERAWAEFSEVAKELFITAKKEDVAVVATAQLSAESASRRFLDLSCVGKSRAIAETATQVVMMRTMTSEEKTKLQVFVWDREAEEDGKYQNVKKVIPLDPDKEYIILFTPKNRFGAVNPQIVYERNMSFNTMNEIGYVEINYDGFR